MIKLVELKQTLEDDILLQDMYEVEKLFKDIIKCIESDKELNVEDYRFLNLVFKKTKLGLKKVLAILKIGGEK
jgi:hypothetical protein